MNSRHARVYLIAAALAASGCVAPERYEATIQRSWPADAIRSVKVDEVDGSLKVQAGDAKQIVLVAHVKSRGIAPTREENSGYFKTEISGDTLRIGQRRKRAHVSFPFVRGPRLQIDYTLQVPRTVSLDLKTVNGRIAARGVDGENNFTTVNGAIELETSGTNEVFAKTVNGSVRAKFLSDFRGAKLKTVNGRVAAILPSNASFSCDLSQVNGDFEASFPLSIHSHPGSRRVSGDVNGGQYALRITTVNGDVQVQHLPELPSVPAVPAIPAVPNGTDEVPSVPPVPTPPVS